MPRPRQNADLQLGARQAEYVLDRVVAEAKLLSKFAGATRAMDRTLRTVDVMPADQAAGLLGCGAAVDDFSIVESSELNESLSAARESRP